MENDCFMKVLLSKIIHEGQIIAIDGFCKSVGNKPGGWMDDNDNKNNNNNNNNDHYNNNNGLLSAHLEPDISIVSSKDSSNVR